MVPEALVAIVVGVSLWWLLRRVAVLGTTNPDRSPTDDERRRRYAATRSVIADLGVIRPGAIETALFLLTEAKASLDIERSISDGFAARGTTLLGLAAGASGALGILSSTHLGSPLAATPLTLCAMICLIVAIGCALYLLRAKHCETLDIGPYISASMISEDNRCGLALTLALCHWKTAQQLSDEARHEPRALFAACVSINAAAVLVLANAVTLIPKAPVVPHGGRPAASRSVLHPSANPITMPHGKLNVAMPRIHGARP